MKIIILAQGGQKVAELDPRTFGDLNEAEARDRLLEEVVVGVRFAEMSEVLHPLKELSDEG